MAKAVSTPVVAGESVLAEAFRAALRTSTPITAIETADPASTIVTLTKVIGEKRPILSWDIVRGPVGLNPPGVSAIKALGVDPALLVNEVEMLLAASRLPVGAVLFMHNLHLQLRDGAGVPKAAVVQALWNLRDVFKLNQRMVVGLGPVFSFPPELAGDAIILDEPLPTRDELGVVFDQQFTNANLPQPSDESRTAALDALIGLPSFTAEQVTAMALEKAGVSVPKLWTRKLKIIDKVPGLTSWKWREGDTTLDELRGIDNAVSFLRDFIEVDAFGLVVYIDEADKGFAGGMSDHTGDSGVAKDQVGQFLTYVNDGGHYGVMLGGWAGTGKTQLSKAVGYAAKKPVLMLDFGGMKGGIVGQSEERVRNVLKILTAMAMDRKILFIASANRTTIFTPEFNRRFPDQFFFDLPTGEARKAIWDVYVAKNKLTPEQAAFPEGFDHGWSPDEIRRACERAALFKKSVLHVSQHIIPSSLSGKARLKEMREQAHERFLSASEPGLYRMPDADGGVAATLLMPTGVSRSIEVG